MNLESNAAGLVRVGLVALLLSALYPIYQIYRGHPSPTADLSTIVFRAGLFCALLGVSLRHGWLRANAARDAQQADAAGGPQAVRG